MSSSSSDKQNKGEDEELLNNEVKKQE